MKFKATQSHDSTQALNGNAASSNPAGSKAGAQSQQVVAQIVSQATASMGRVYDSVFNEALTEIVEELLKRPKDAFFFARLVKKQEMFQTAVKRNPEVWLHGTRIRFTNMSKKWLRGVIVRYAKGLKKRDFTDEALKLHDKQTGLQGVFKMFLAFANLDAGCKIPKIAFFKPLLELLLVYRFNQDVDSIKRVRLTKQGELVNGTFGFYAFTGIVDEKYTRIEIQMGPRKGESIPIPREFSVFVGDAPTIVDNHSMRAARMKSRKIDENMWQMFAEAHENDEEPWELENLDVQLVKAAKLVFSKLTPDQVKEFRAFNPTGVPGDGDDSDEDDGSGPDEEPPKHEEADAGQLPLRSNSFDDENFEKKNSAGTPDEATGGANATSTDQAGKGSASAAAVKPVSVRKTQKGKHIEVIIEEPPLKKSKQSEEEGKSMMVPEGSRVPLGIA